MAEKTPENRLNEIEKELDNLQLLIQKITQDDRKHRYQEVAIEGVISPVVDNEVSSLVDKMLFHTTSGRTVVLGMIEFGNAMKTTLALLVATRMNAIIVFILESTETNAESLSLAAIICFILLIIMSIYTSFVDNFIAIKLGPMRDIYEQSNDDRLLATLKEKKS